MIIGTATACTDTDNGKKDDAGDGCSAYANNKFWCGLFDSRTFKSKKMCCACGGGTTGNIRWNIFIFLESLIKYKWDFNKHLLNNICTSQ